MLRCIDVSEYNGYINWGAVEPQVDGAIVRVGYRGYGWAGTMAVDARLHHNLRGAKEKGVPVGAYWVSQAVTESEALAEAEFVHNHLKGYDMELPVFLDSEWGEAKNGTGRADGISKAKRTRYGLTFLRKLREHGYVTGLYCAESWFHDELDGEAFRQNGHVIWLASVEHVEPTTPYDGWQFSWKGNVDGIVGDVDLNVFEKEALLRMGRYYTDTNGHWAEDAIDRMRDEGLMNGKTESLFDPDAPITRAEVATVIARLLDKK